MLEIYKRGQGVKARWVAAGTLLAFAVYGCIALNERLAESDWGQTAVAGPLSWSVLVSVLAFIAAVLLTGLVVNHKRFVDYLINSEAELRKVSWPTKPELKRQTIVVIIGLALFATLLFVIDVGFGWFSQQLFGL